MTPKIEPVPDPSFQDEYRRRQRARATMTALALGAMVVLFFAIAIVRMS